MTEIVNMIEETEMQTRKQKKNNNAQNKDRKEQVGAEALVKGWEVNGFVLH